MITVTGNSIANKIVFWLAWLLLGFLCLGYALFWSNFAELHLELPFLNFPIFIGEIFLAIGLVLLFLRWKLTAFSFKGWHYLLFLYVIWIFIKALWGYVTYGPLAFRNAALFYYPLFAVVAYHFYQKELFNPRTIVILLISIILIRSTINFAPYYFYPSLALYVILSLRLQHRAIRYCALGLVVFLFPYVNIIHDGKSAIVGNGLASLFLIYGAVFLYLKANRRTQLLAICVITAIFFGIFLQFGRKNPIEALTTPLHVLKSFKESQAIIAERKKIYQPLELAAGIYDPEKMSLSSNIFLRLNPATQLTFRDEDIKNLNIDKISATIDKHAEVLRISVVRSIRVTKENNVLALKARIGALEDQKKAVDILEKVAQQQINKATQSIDHQKEEVIKNIKSFMAGQEISSMPFMETKAKIQQLASISHDDIIKEAVATIIQQRGISADEYKRKINPPVLTQQQEPVILEKKEEKPTLMPAVTIDAKPMKSFKEDQEYIAKQTDDMVEWYTKKEVQVAKSDIARPLSQEYGNMQFRLFIWHDMLEELLQKPRWQHFLWGINFGKPQRSISLEVSLYGYTDWMRDGWITPHNSYLNLIYRGGIIGWVIIIGLGVIVIRLIKQFLAARSLIGMWLISILVYWLTIANFLVFLEIPQHAITFWSFLGMVIAHSHNSQKG